MTIAAIAEAEEYRNRAQGFRNRAKRCMSDGNSVQAKTLMQRAIMDHQKAVRVLTLQYRIIRQQGESKDDCKILEALSQSHGSLGGTLRDAWRLKLEDGAIEKAIAAYDSGYKVEQERLKLCHSPDSYNLLQRLVVRVLRRSACLRDSSTDLGSGLDVPIQLRRARDEIERQFEAGRRDSWAKADLVLAEFLCEGSADKRIADLEQSNPDPAFYRSTHEVVVSLLKEFQGLQLTDASSANLERRLQQFRRLLERKGGLDVSGGT